MAQFSVVLVGSKNSISFIHKDIFACLFSIHNIISLSCHEQVSLSGLRYVSISFTRLKSSLTRNIICFICNTKQTVENS